MPNCQPFAAARFDAFIFDLDGVVTETATLHASAWKTVFDDFLTLQGRQTGQPQALFDIESDYPQHVDGKPRYEGAASFLSARGFKLPFGQPSDSPGQKTICGLGNRKNEVYRQLLEAHGVKVYEGAVQFIRRLREARIKVALVTSSRNGRAVLKAAELTELFDYILDGEDAARLELEGKPAPDIFLEAARQVRVAPERAVVVEDAQSGVEAGRRGNFGCVIGVGTDRHGARLRSHGADFVVADLGGLTVDDHPGDLPQQVAASALDHIAEIEQRIGGCVPVVFLDFDGTLTPIVRRPEEAHLDEAMRAAVAQLAQYCRVAVISGRDLPDVRERVGLPQLHYAGSHGFDISGPQGKSLLGKGEEFLPRIEQVEALLKRRLAGIQGAHLERKKYSLAVHYREVPAERAGEVAAIVEQVHAQNSDLRRKQGKKIFELQPDIDWHKGRAVRWLLTEAMHPGRQALPIYIGDDVTDEDAFAEVRSDGIGILVEDNPGRESLAHYRLSDTEAVRLFLEKFTQLLRRRDAQDEWRLRYTGYEPQSEGSREALTTLGNGYFCTRGASAQAVADGIHYPGTYLAGGYNRLKSEIEGHILENEDLVNLPNWLPLTFRIEESPWFDPANVELLDYLHELDIHNGVLHRRWRFRDDAQRITAVHEQRLIHMENPHLAAIQLTLRPENWSGRIQVRTAIDGRVRNEGVMRYRALSNHHLRPHSTQAVDTETILLQCETNQSGLRIAMAARTRFFLNQNPAPPPNRECVQQPAFIGQLCTLQVASGETLHVEKVISLFTSRDPAIGSCDRAARRAVAKAPAFEALLRRQSMAWEHLWQSFDLQLQPKPDLDFGDARQISMVVHLHTFHLLQTTSVNDMRLALDAGVPCRGWHGEAYRGHVLWDELFIFPLINLRLPEITKNLLMYRYRRLDAARDNARSAGFRGAMYPWQSGSSGREESQRIHLNPRSGRWVPDHSRLQRHVNIAVAFNLYQYYQVTRDREFLSFYGAEMIVEVARFLASLTRYNPAIERYEICKVMGPDEYHDAYPDAVEPGLDNNAYTNVMTVWVLQAAEALLTELPEPVRRQVCEKIDLRPPELEMWQDICRKMKIVFHDDHIISQFEGYGDLLEFDWDAYRRRYGDIHRLDRILEAENDTPNRYKVSKQADVLMLFYLLSAEEFSQIIERLGYHYTPEMIPRNIDYYLARTSHGSTLSRVVHAWVLARKDRPHAWHLFREALLSDVNDIQGGTTAEGIHLGAMAGTVDQLQRGYTGIVTRRDVLWFNPCLPEELQCLRMRLRYRNHFIEVEVTAERLTITSLPTAREAIRVGFRDQVVELPADSSRVFEL
jgi:alpha,alpha-trehalase